MRRLSFALVSAAALAGASVAAEPAKFSPSDAAPYFPSGPASAARAHLELEELAAAADGFTAYVQAHPHAADRLPAQLMAAYASSRAGRYDVAATAFAALEKSYPLLSDYAALWGGRAQLAGGHAQAALAAAGRVSEGSVLAGEALLLTADADTALGARAEAVAPWTAYVTRFPTSWRISEIRFALAERLRELGRNDEATALYRRVWLDVPQLPLAERAKPYLGPAPFTADELYGRAMALFDQMRNADSERALAELLARPDVAPQLACRARYNRAQSVFKARDRWRSAPLFDEAATACEKAHDDDLRGKSLYQAGRAWGNHAEKDPVAAQNAVARFERVWKELPSHSYADDAQLREAEIFDTAKDPARAAAIYQGLPAAFPAGDQRSEALWRLAFRAWLAGDRAGCATWLKSELAILPRPGNDRWWEAGRTLYWLGRVAEADGDHAAANDYYAQAVSLYPLSYYALLGLTRLQESAPQKARALVVELAGHVDAANDRWSFAPRALFGEPGFRRGIELARLGLTTEAKRELAAVGLAAPQKKPDPLDTDTEEKLWLTAVVYDRAGDWALSHDIPRRLLSEWSRSYPSGDNRKRWALAYPRGFDELITTQAQKNGVPPSLEMAIVREESAFDPRMESFANAIGLTQLTAAPAERFAEGLAHDGRALRDPVINVTIGARELAHCLTAEGHPALAIAAYNAGEGAVRRWRRTITRPLNSVTGPQAAVASQVGVAAPLTVDELVEAIPYDETRGYTKRVLSTYFTYYWMAAKSTSLADRLPPFPLDFASKP